MTERKYTADEIRRWANDPDTALFSVLNAENARDAVVATAATTAASYATSAAGPAVISAGSNSGEGPRRSATHPTDEAARSSPSLPSRSRKQQEPRRTLPVGIHGLLARLRRYLQLAAAPSLAPCSRLRDRGTGRSLVDPSAADRSAQASPCSVCSAPSVGATPATGSASIDLDSGAGLTFSLAPGRVTVLFEPDRLDVADVIAAVSAVVKRGGRP